LGKTDHAAAMRLAQVDSPGCTRGSSSDTPSRHSGQSDGFHIVKSWRPSDSSGTPSSPPITITVSRTWSGRQEILGPPNVSSTTIALVDVGSEFWGSGLDSPFPDRK